MKKIVKVPSRFCLSKTIFERIKSRKPGCYLIAHVFDLGEGAQAALEGVPKGTRFIAKIKVGTRFKLVKCKLDEWDIDMAYDDEPLWCGTPALVVAVG